LLDEVRKAGDANILFVASGGNSSYDIDPPNYSHGHYPCSFDNANTFGSYDAGTGSFETDTFEQSLGPAKNVVCVASSDNDDRRSSFSNWGPHTIQLAAPGTYIYSTNQVGSYSVGSGTSFSTPFVSGVAALLLSLRPDLDVVVLKHALVGTYSQESTPYTGCPCGYQGGGAVEQLPAFDSLLSTGGGRLDACKAIPGCGADFAVIASPTGRSVTRGESTSYMVTIAPSSGFTGPVSLSENGLPGGASASFSPNPTTSSSTLSVTTTGAIATGSFPVTIRGTSGGLTHAATVTLEIQAPPPPAPPPPPPPTPLPPAVSCHVPAVKGKQLAIARRRIRKAHCAVGAIRHARPKKKRGLVIAQRPPAGRTLPKAARVSLVVSRGR
jgi:hypothetical protein